MLYTKISPTAKTTRKVNPFTTEVFESDYMTAVALNYGAGARRVQFKAVFGIIENGAFYKKDETPVTLSAEEFAAWGADDSVLLEIIANKIGAVNLEYIDTELGDSIV